MAKEVHMQVPQVRNMAKTYGKIGDALKNVSRILDALLGILYATAFIGNVGAMAKIHWIERIKPPIDQLAKECAEMMKDLNFSVDAYERGDTQGATRFY